MPSTTLLVDDQGAPRVQLAAAFIEDFKLLFRWLRHGTGAMLGRQTERCVLSSAHFCLSLHATGHKPERPTSQTQRTNGRASSAFVYAAIKTQNLGQTILPFACTDRQLFFCCRRTPLCARPPSKRASPSRTTCACRSDICTNMALELCALPCCPAACMQRICMHAARRRVLHTHIQARWRLRLIASPVCNPAAFCWSDTSM